MKKGLIGRNRKRDYGAAWARKSGIGDTDRCWAGLKRASRSQALGSCKNEKKANDIRAFGITRKSMCLR